MDPLAILERYSRGAGDADASGALGVLAHAWRCARLARLAGAAPGLQLAAWLHDLGDHLEGGPPAPMGARQALAAEVLMPLFGLGVARPIGLMGAARRCLASRKPDFRRGLAAAALEALEGEGGPMPAGEARAFLQQPYAPQAMRLSLWDAQAHGTPLHPPSTTAALDTLRRLMWLLEVSAMPRSGGGVLRPTLPVRAVGRLGAAAG